MSAPEKIYLQWEIEDPVTWCVDEQDDTDIEYIRADKVAELRDALEAVEWVFWKLPNTFICPWCEEVKEQGHAPDCQRQKALE